MSQELEKAIEALEVELQNITLRVTEIKKTINSLLYLNGSGPKYTDIESEVSGNSKDIQARRFLGKDMPEAVKEVMRLYGKNPLTAQEVLEALEKGDFAFPPEWKKKLKLKNLAIFLGSRKDKFVWFETKGGKVYALAEQYQERKRELERQTKSKNAPPDSSEFISGNTPTPK